MQLLKTYNSEAVNTVLTSMALMMLPLYQGLLSAVLIGLILNSIMASAQSNPLKRLKSNVFFNFSWGYGIIYLIGMIFTENWEQAKFDTVQKLSVSILGAMILIGGLTKQQNMQWIKRAFLISNLLACLLCFAISFQYYLKSGSLDEFTYVSLSHFLHPAFFSIYLCFCLALLLNSFIQRSDIIPWLGLSLLMIIIFSATIYLLASKSGIITMFIIISFFAFKYIQGKVNSPKGRTIAIISAFALISSLVFAAASSKRFSSMIADLRNIQTSSDENIDTAGQRILVWSSALTVVKANFWLGTGTGNDNYALNEEFKRRDYEFLYVKNLNAHNQFLQTFMALGIGGFLFFFIYAMLPFWYGIKHKDFLLISFGFIMLINMLTESVLNRQAGIVFWTIWGSLLFAHLKKTENPD